MRTLKRVTPLAVALTLTLGFTALACPPGPAGYTCEGIAFYVATYASIPAGGSSKNACKLATVPGYYVTDHYYTTNINEKNALLASGSWKFQGGLYYECDWIVDVTNTGYPTTTVWRVRNPYTGHHMFTANHDEYRSLVNAGWVDELGAFNAFAYHYTTCASYSPCVKTAPVYRYFNSTTGDHFFSKDGVN